MKQKAVFLIAGILFIANCAFAQCTPGSVVLKSFIHDVSCNAGSDGQIVISVLTGTAPYTYAWSNGTSNDTAVDLTAGSYGVTVTDGNGCSASLSNLNVAQPGPFIYNVTIRNETCFGSCDGALDFFMAGGTPPYTYQWTNPTTGANLGTTEDISNLCSGIYRLGVTDANGCTGGIFYLIASPARLNITGSITNVTCPGGSDGKIILTVTGGTGTKFYTWSTGETSKNLLNKPAGTYTVTVTDVNGCTASNSFTITEPPAITATATNITNITCNGGDDGSIDITVTGGTGPYTYVWSNGATTQDISNLSAGQYCVTITDSKACVSQPFCFTVTDAPPITVTATITPVTCENGTNGAIDITVSNGTPPFTFTWSTGATTEDISGLAAGLYVVSVTDSNGCSQTATFTVATENILVVSVGITQPTCGETNGSATVSISGGTAPYTYHWSNGQTGATIDSVGAGVNVITVTDANGCTASENVDISNANSGITVTGTVTNALCGSPNSGSITITVSGGTPPYSILWSTGSSSLTISGLAAGTYSVVVTDSAGCIAVQSFEVTQESGLTLTPNSTNATCGEKDGTAGISVTGGTAPYTYHWSTGASSSSISGLEAGTYLVTVTDANGCSATATVNISASGGPQFNITKDDIDCTTGTGSLSVTNITGNGPFTITWSTGETTATISGLGAGTYTVTVTSTDTCETIASATINPPTRIILNAAPTPPTCHGASDGSIDVTVSGGLPPFTFNWNSGAQTEDLSGLNGGTYSVTATDANGCTATTTINLDEPDEIIATADSISQPICNNDTTGIILISVTGGTPPYTFVWSNGDTTQNLMGVTTGHYCVTITDAHGCTSTPACFDVQNPDSLQLQPTITQPFCNGEDDGSISVAVSGGVAPYTYEWSNGDTTNSISGLPAGDYTLTVTDATGCSTEETYTINEPDTLTVSVSNSSNVTCNGANDGSITVSVSGGTAPYHYDWSTGDTIPSLTGLPPGDYSVTVTDAHGCSDSSGTITITQPDSLTLSANVTQPSCLLPGNIDLTVNGGTAPYTYIWSDSSTLQDIPVITDGGTFSVTVTDAHGCTASASFTINDTPVMTVNITVTQELRCNADSNGALCAIVAGVPGPYSFIWSNGDTTQCSDGLPAGVYSVTATDANGCSAAQTQFILDDPDAIQITSTNITPVTCNGGNDGAITVTATGGVPPYVYQWSNGDFGNTADNLEGGPVTVTATDANGCTASATFTIPQPPPFDFSNTEVHQPTCDTATDGSITIVVSGGNGPYGYEWENGVTGPVRQNLPEGTYSVTVTDVNGCTGSATYTLDGPRCNNPPVAVQDTVKIYACMNETATIPVLDNDYDIDGDSIYLSALFGQPAHGTASINPNQTIIYIPDSGFIGLDTLAYVICEANVSPSYCDTGMVIIVVLPCRPNIRIPNGVSPNGDGINDNFVIPGIEFFPDNELLIFNRWGNKVREFKGYKNEWSGTNESGDPLPDATYYYILKLHDNANTTYTGYVIIQR